MDVRLRVCLWDMSTEHRLLLEFLIVRHRATSAVYLNEWHEVPVSQSCNQRRVMEKQLCLGAFFICNPTILTFAYPLVCTEFSKNRISTNLQWDRSLCKSWQLMDNRCSANRLQNWCRFFCCWFFFIGHEFCTVPFIPRALTATYRSANSVMVCSNMYCRIDSIWALPCIK